MLSKDVIILPNVPWLTGMDPHLLTVSSASPMSEVTMPHLAP